MNTKQILLVSIACLCILFSANAQRGVRIGYIDMEYILENVPEYIEASTQLDGKVQRWKADIDKKQQEIDLMKLTLTNERVLLTKELIEEREEEIKIKEDEMISYQQNRFGSGGDLVIQRRQLVQPIQDQVFNIVQEKVTQGGFSAALKGAKVRKVRKIKSFEKDLKINQDLFKLATALV